MDNFEENARKKVGSFEKNLEFSIEVLRERFGINDLRLKEYFYLRRFVRKSLDENIKHLASLLELHVELKGKKFNSNVFNIEYEAPARFIAYLYDIEIYSDSPNLSEGERELLRRKRMKLIYS